MKVSKSQIKKNRQPAKKKTTNQLISFVTCVVLRFNVLFVQEKSLFHQVNC